MCVVARRSLCEWRIDRVCLRWGPQLDISRSADINHGRTLPVKDTFLDHVSIGALLVRPHSRGTIKIKSASPFDHAIIDPNCALASLRLR